MSYAWKDYCLEEEIDFKDRVSMRAWHKESHATRKNPDGSNAYITEQSGKDQCDINLIIAKYPQRIIASKMAKDEAVFADVSGMDYQTSLNMVKDTERNFMKLPAEVRAKFDNDPAKYLDFLARPAAAEDDIKEVYDDPKRKKSKNAPSMKDSNKDGVPDKLENDDK